jgi:valyl-tRNA synthetase
MEVSDTIPQPESLKVAIEWYECNKPYWKSKIILKNTEFRSFNGDLQLVWDDFCSWFLEMIKPTTTN